MNGVSVTRMATARNDFTLDVPLGGDYRARLGIKRSCIWTSFRITGHFFRKPFGTIPRVKKLDVFGRIRQAATDGDPFAQFEVGLDYDWGTNDFKKAAEFYLKASEQGHRSATNNLLLQQVLGQARVYQPALVFNKLSDYAESGDREAQNNLGLCYQLGYGTEQDYGRAAIWFRRAAEGGLATGQFNIGGLYFEGNGLEKDLNIAIAWYTRAAEQRHELALLQLGNIYQKGLGEEINLNRAFLLYLIAYRLGSARAANHLGFMFKKGLGVEQNDSLAFELYLESVNRPDTPEAKVGHSYHSTAYYWLGHMTENGEGTKRDRRAAIRWYKRGADCGLSSCVNALARLSFTPKRRRSKAVH